MRSAPELLDQCETLVELLQRRAALQADDRAFTFLISGEERQTYSYAELDAHARTIAAGIQARVDPGQPVLLVYPSGLDYIAAFFACLYAGVIAVPVYPPRAGRGSERLLSVALDSGAPLALGPAETLATLDRLRAAVPSLTFVATDALDPAGGEGWADPGVSGDKLAFLQYTSGSTGDPKGVMLSHANLLHNERMMAECFDTRVEFSCVGWLPLYHDMGLIGNVLHPLSIGRPCVLMAPEAFLMRPYRWLEAISRYGATTSGAPDFAYELCVQKVKPERREGLDLSRWRVAYNGAEPIRAATLRRFTEAFGPYGFSAEAFCPCYGLAEATLLVAGAEIGRPPRVVELSAEALLRDEVEVASSPDDVRTLVGCGHTWLDQQLQIVDPSSRRVRAPGQVGEIWVRGPSVARGYFGKPETSEEVFCARLAEDSDADPGTGAGWLRTGDLGFIGEQSELFVTGRLKDLVILAGRNYYPHDLERAAAEADSGIRQGGVVASSVDHEGAERLLIVVEVTLRRHELGSAMAGRLDAMEAAIRQRLFAQEGVAPQVVVFVRSGSVLRTTSGKLRRRATRRAYLDGRLEALRG